MMVCALLSSSLLLVLAGPAPDPTAAATPVAVPDVPAEVAATVTERNADDTPKAIAATTPKSPKPAEKPAEESDAKKELDKLKAGKLIRWGITAGVAPTFFLPVHSYKHEGRRHLSVPDIAVLTYVMLHPFYWQRSPETNIYCANRWAGEESEAAADRAANTLSSERAALMVERILDAHKADALADDDVTAIACVSGKCVKNTSQVRALAGKAAGTGAEADAARATLVAVVQRSTYDWTSGISAKCGSRMLGVWFGYPLKFTATIPTRVTVMGVPEIRRDRLEITPIFATGLGLSPNAYISLLAGIALGRTNIPPSTDKDDEVVISFLFGLGGNLDLVGLLLKK